MFGLTAILAWIIKAIYNIVKIFMYIIAHVLAYFGLWIPAVYMIICGILMLTTGLDIRVINVNSILFYIGLGLTLLGSLIISIRHMIITPIHQVIESEKAKKELRDRKESEKKQKLYERNPAKYFTKYEGGMPHKSHPVYDPEIDRKGFVPPDVYRSKNDPTIIIHEYSTHFKVFKEYSNGDVKLIDIKEKSFNKEDKKRHGKSKRK